MPERRSAIPLGRRPDLAEPTNVKHGGPRWLAAAACTLAMIALTGCGPKSDRLQVSGDVTLGGTPLDIGSIRFTSLGEGKLMTSGAQIRDGAYNIPQEKGLLVGAYQVEITSPDTKAPPIFDRASGMQTAPERIPPAYNTESQQTVEVTADGDNQFDFTIPNMPAK